jgi:hypothetical protein
MMTPYRQDETPKRYMKAEYLTILPGFIFLIISGISKIFIRKPKNSKPPRRYVLLRRGI